MDERIQRLVLWSRGVTANPYRIEAELSDRCNSHCIFCWRNHPTFPRAVRARADDGKKELSDEQWLNLIDISAKLGVRQWHITGGGEPLLRLPLIKKMVERIKEHGIYGEITTNGMLVDDHLAQILVLCGWDQIEFSIEAPFAELNNRLRGHPQALQLAVNNLRKIRKWKYFYHSELPRLQIASVLTSANYTLLPDLMEFAHQEGCIKLSVNPLIAPYDTIKEALALKMSEQDIQNLPPYIEKAKKIADKYNMETNVDDFLQIKYVARACDYNSMVMEEFKDKEKSFFNAHCFIPWLTIAIRPSGIAGPCVAFKEEEGEHYPVKDLPEIWKGNYFSSIRFKLIEKDLPDYCDRCCAPFIIEGKRIQELLKATP